MRNLISLGIAMSFSLLPANAPAQVSGVFDMGQLTGSLSMDAVTQSEARRARDSGAFRSMLRPQTRGPARINPAALAFRPDLAARKRNMARFVANIRRADPAGAKGLQDVLAKHDLIAEMNRQLPAGIRPNSVPDAMALYLVTAWYGVRGSTDSKPADFRVVRDQFARAVGTTPGFATTSNAEKQELSESMLLQAMIADQAVQNAKGDPATLRQIRSALNAGARATFGFDLTRMRLGPNGLS